MRRFLCIAFVLLLGSMPASAFRLRMQGERFSLHADHESLTDILRGLARCGVTVRIDPRVESKVSANFTDEDTQKALDEVLQPFGYVLVWDVVEGPVGPLPKLGEVQVFLPGEKKNLKPLPGVDHNLHVVRGPTGSGPKFVADEILLGFKPGTSRHDVEILLNQIGGTVIASIPAIGIYQIRLPPGTNISDLVDQLNNKPIVARAEPDYVIEAPPPVLTASDGTQIAYNPVTAIKGAGALAILDSGLQDNSDLNKLVVARLDALDPERPLTDPVGHGTQMALIASGAIDPQTGEPPLDSGKSVPLVAIRAFDDNGMASNFGLMLSINFAVSQGAQVINLSWGTETPSDFLATTIAYAESKGLLVVAAAGNQPTGQPEYPAAYPGVIGVSAVGANNLPWDQSNYGDFVSVSAPGFASFPVGYEGPPGAYAGTSISSAYVARNLALYLAQNPGATATSARQALLNAVTPPASGGKNPHYGYGVLDTAAIGRLLK